MPWREFCWRISGLLSMDSRIARHLHGQKNDDHEEEMTDDRTY